MEGQRHSRQFRSRRRPTVELDQGQVVADAEAVETLRELGLDTLEGAMAFERGQLVRAAGTRQTWRVETGRGAWYVKIHKGKETGFSLTSMLRSEPGPARREWDAIAALGRDSFDCPEPVAMGESTASLGPPARSFVITREVPGPTLAEAVERLWSDKRERVIRDVAGMIRRFHAAGFFHRDLYLAHLIVAPDPRWGRPYFIDLARVKQCYPPRERWLVKDLAALESSCPPVVSRTDKLRFLLVYLCKQRLDPLARRWVRAVLAKSSRIQAREPKFP